MTVKRFVHFSVALLVLSSCLLPSRAAFADSLPPPNGSVEISEIYANPPGSPESAAEFIELHNTLATPVDLAGFELLRDDTPANPNNLLGVNGKMALSGTTLQPDEYLAIRPSFALVNSTSTISLRYPIASAFSVKQTYSSPPDGSSWQLSSSGWKYAAPTANSPPVAEPPVETPPGQGEVPEEEVPENEPPEESEPACDIENVHISEIVANPAGVDSAGGEFIELYNANNTAAKLAGCELLTSKSARYDFGSADEINAKSYKALIFHDGLINSSGSVKFTAASYEEIIEYPQLNDDEAYALIGGTWQTTKKLTPNTPNALPTPEEELEPGLGGLAPCPPGKFRNPATNRCKNIASSGSSLAACKLGQYRNPETNRCRNFATASANLTPCKPGYERNLATNRCRKGGNSNDVSLKPCKTGYERNLETNRCRKMAALGATTHFNDPTSSSGNSPLNVVLILIATIFVAFFLLYEYRLSIRDKLAALRVPWVSGRK